MTEQTEQIFVETRLARAGLTRVLGLSHRPGFPPALICYLRSEAGEIRSRIRVDGCDVGMLRAALDAHVAGETRSWSIPLRGGRSAIEISAELGDSDRGIRIRIAYPPTAHPPSRGAFLCLRSELEALRDIVDRIEQWGAA